MYLWVKNGMGLSFCTGLLVQILVMSRCVMNGLGQTPDQIHAIGHSLGGHVVGHFGRSVNELGGQGQIARVTCKKKNCIISGPYFIFHSFGSCQTLV